MLKTIGQFMFRRKVLSGAIAIALVVLAAFIALSMANAPVTSGVRVAECLKADGGACLRFPSVIGTSLVGVPFTLPDDFAGDFNLILMPFDEDQQVRAASWLPLAREMAGVYPEFAYYDLPTLPAVNPLLRGVIAAGMALVIPDEEIRGLTIMLFLEDLDVFLAALAITDREATQVFLLNASGEVVWRTRGDFSDGAAAELREAIEARMRPQ